MIGNTPMVKIKYRYKGKEQSVYAKIESYNLTGSIKDRVAYYILSKAKERGELQPNMPIVEATSGNTGISLAALAAYYNHPCHIYMPDWVSVERKQIMKLFGANVTLFSKEEGGFSRCIQEAKQFAKEHNGFLANQFSNLDNVLAHYETTGKEITQSVYPIDGFVSGIGTGGTLMGIGKRILEENPNAIICALEPDTMALLSGGEVTSHKIEGIGDDFIPEIVDQKQIEEVIQIHDTDAIAMARKLGSELGLGVGISSGANFIGAILLKEKIDGNIVTVFPDDHKKYLTTDLTSSEKMDASISDQVELLDYQVVVDSVK